MSYDDLISKYVVFSTVYVTIDNKYEHMESFKVPQSVGDNHKTITAAVRIIAFFYQILVLN